MVKIDFDRPGLDSTWGATYKYLDNAPADSATMGAAEGAEFLAKPRNVELNREFEDVEMMTVPPDKELMIVLSEASVPADDEHAEQVVVAYFPESHTGDEENAEHASKESKKEEFVQYHQRAVEEKLTTISHPRCWSFFASLFKPQRATTSRPDLERPVPVADPDLERALLESASLTEAKEVSVAIARVRLQRVMEKYQAKARPVEADGNCQFRALALQLHGDESQHAKVRSATVEWLKCMQERYWCFVHEPYEDYINRMASDGQWGDNVTLQAASDMLGRHIHILNDQPGAEHISVQPAHTAHCVTEKPLWLSFLGEMHYDAVEFL